MVRRNGTAQTTLLCTIFSLLQCTHRFYNMKYKAKLNLLAKNLQLDATVLLSIIAKLWNSSAYLITTVLLISFFSPEEQGFYYTFSSLLAIQVFAELGLGQIILQFTSHEWAGLHFTIDGSIDGDAACLARLKELATLSLRWFGTASVIATIILLAAGPSFFRSSGVASNAWLWPWIALCVVAGCKLIFIPVWAIVEGANEVKASYTFKAIDGLLVSVTMWLCISLGLGLWTSAIAGTASICWAIIFLTRRYSRALVSLVRVKPQNLISWRREIWPLQWKIALSWLSGYFSFSLFTPIVFHYSGPVLAGRMGMTWTLVNGISGIASSWTTPRTPQFGKLIAQRKFSDLDRLFFRSTLASCLIAALGAAMFWGGVFMLNRFNHPWALRILSPWPTALFLIAMILMQISSPQAAYLRAHKQEPFLVLSLIGGILITITALVLGRNFGATGIAAGYSATVTFFILPYGSIIWYRCRAAWHHRTEFSSPVTVDNRT